MTETEHTLLRDDGDGGERELLVVVEGRCYPEERASAHDPGSAAYAELHRVTLAGTRGGCILDALTLGEREQLKEALIQRAEEDARDAAARWAESRAEVAS